MATFAQNARQPAPACCILLPRVHTDIAPIAVRLRPSEENTLVRHLTLFKFSTDEILLPPNPPAGSGRPARGVLVAVALRLLRSRSLRRGGCFCPACSRCLRPGEQQQGVGFRGAGAALSAFLQARARPPLVEHRRCGGGRLAPLFVAERTMKLPHVPQLAPKSGRPRPNRAFGRGRYLMSLPSPSVGKAPDCEGERDFIWKAQVRRCALLRASGNDICYRRWCSLY